MVGKFLKDWSTGGIITKASILPVLRYSFFIGKLKLMIVLIAIVLISAIIIWPLTNIGQRGFKLSFKSAEITAEDKNNNRMIKPRFHGLDDNNQPYNIRADDAVQKDKDNVLLHGINGDILLKDGAWISITSKTGTYNIVKKQLDLKGSVNLFTDSGYEVFTETAQINLNKNIIVGNEDINVKGPLGTLKSKEFVISDNGGTIFFHGGVHLIAYPSVK